MFLHATAASLLALTLAGQPAFAAGGQEAAPSGLQLSEITFTVSTLGTSPVRTPLRLAVADPPAANRPAALPALYATLAAAQALDAYMTRRGIDGGAREVNPLVQSSAALWTLKAAGTAVPVLLAERMWKRHRIAAVVTMVLANGVMTAVAVNNAQVLARRR